MRSMGSRLPGWAEDGDASIAREAEPYRDMPDEEKIEIMRALCRASARLIAARDDGYDVLEHRDPLPESSIRILARLRREARTRRDRADD